MAKTKFGINELVYFLHANQIFSSRVKYISINQYGITYSFNKDIKRREGELFDSRDDLLNNLKLTKTREL